MYVVLALPLCLSEMQSIMYYSVEKKQNSSLAVYRLLANYVKCICIKDGSV